MTLHHETTPLVGSLGLNAMTHILRCKAIRLVLPYSEFPRILEWLLLASQSQIALEMILIQ